MPQPIRVVVMPRWAGRSSDDWYPWIRARFEALGTAEITVLDPPDPQTPTTDAWTKHLRDAMAEDLDTLASTVVVGHSVACQAVLRWASTLPAELRVGAVLLVAAWWAVDEPWPSIEPWMQIDYELERARSVAPKLHVLLSDNDPFTADFGANAQLWRTRTDARVRVVPDAKHFNGAEEPAVLEALDELVTGVRAAER